MKFTAHQTAVSYSLDKKFSKRKERNSTGKITNPSKWNGLLFSAIVIFLLLLHYKIHYICFIIETKIQLEQDSRTAGVAVLHSLAIETWLASRTFPLDLEDTCSKNTQWVTFMPLTPLHCLQEKKRKNICYSVYFFCSKNCIKFSVNYFFQMTFKRHLRYNELDSINYNFRKTSKENW